MRVSLLGYAFSDWAGGIDFIRYLGNSIAATTAPTVGQRQLILPSADLIYRAKKIAAPIRNAILQRYTQQKMEGPSQRTEINFERFRSEFCQLAGAFYFARGGSSLASQIREARRFESDVMLPLIQPPRRDLGIPWVGYVFDFQHKYFPELFSKTIIAHRDRVFREMMDCATNVIVNSKNVAEDISLFFGTTSAKIHPIPFCPCPQLEWLDTRLDPRGKYGLSVPYFIICNQFWKHKDHMTAIAAFSQIADNEEIELVCTGNPSDPRHPRHFVEVQEAIKFLGLGSKVRLLGHISKLDQIGLLKHSIALVQPTQFEGGPGGGSAYDAIALGVPVVASDIPVNLEISCGEISYFNVGNPDSLAAALQTRLSRAPEKQSAERLWAMGLDRRIHCGELLINVLHSAVADHS